ncbi:MAG: hypothetical protein ACYC6B_09180 [Thermoleophilia bacterium]
MSKTETLRGVVFSGADENTLAACLSISPLEFFSVVRLAAAYARFPSR